MFTKLQGLLYYFPENFRCNLTYYERENFSVSSLHHLFESENFRFLFFYEKSLAWEEMLEIKLQKIVGGILDKLQTLHKDGTVVEKFLALLK